MEVTAAERTATYTGAQSLATKINGYIVAQRTSIAAVAKEIGYSRVTVSRYLAGKYDSDPTGIEEKLAAFLTGQTGEAVEFSPPLEPGQKGGQKPRFYESRDAKAILGVCQSSQEYMGLGIVVARSGYGTIWRRVNGIREFFNTNRGYLLIIDEADKLVSKYTQKKMEILRAIFDQSDVGLVIAGEPKLEAQIKTYLARMANRVDFYASLRGLAPSEVEGYLEDFNITQDALLELKERACNMRTGCFRLLDRTLSNVGRILAERGEDTVTVKIIEQASSMMML